MSSPSAYIVLNSPKRSGSKAENCFSLTSLASTFPLASSMVNLPAYKWIEQQVLSRRNQAGQQPDNQPPQRVVQAPV